MTFFVVHEPTILVQLLSPVIHEMTSRAKVLSPIIHEMIGLIQVLSVIIRETTAPKQALSLVEHEKMIFLLNHRLELHCYNIFFETDISYTKKIPYFFIMNTIFS